MRGYVMAGMLMVLLLVVLGSARLSSDWRARMVASGRSTTLDLRLTFAISRDIANGSHSQRK